MEILDDGSGYGNGDGYGSGDGDGYGNGYGNGNGDGYGNGNGNGDGYGNGYGDGNGYGYGDGDGDGDGNGNGYGNGNGDGYGNLKVDLDDSVSIHKISYLEAVMKKSLTPEEIMQIENTEIKRLMIELYGWGHVMQSMNMSEVDTHGGYSLFSCDLNDDEGKKAVFVRVECPSTGRKYLLRVPPEMKSAEEAVAWTFGKTKKEYVLDAET